MKFQEGQVYHVFNQGNNRKRIFFEDENYLYFLRKFRKYLLPYSDILCYCLMPNHFHLLLMPNEKAAKPSKAIKPLTINNSNDSAEYDNQEKLSQAIGTMLSSYSKAVNRRYQRSGSLFRGKTKVKDGWIDEVISVEGKNKELFFRPDNDHALQCFHYIHQNPVKANLVTKATVWVYSSARDYAGLRNGTLCNLALGREMLGILNKG